MEAPSPARPARSGPRRPARSLRRDMWVLLAAFTGCLIGFAVVQTATITSSAREEGTTRAREMAALQSGRLAEEVGAHRHLLDDLAGLDQIRNLTPEGCPQMPIDVGEATLHVVDRAGRVVCSSEDRHRPPGPGPARYAGASWLGERGTAASFHFTDAAPRVGGAVVELVRPAGRNLLVVPFNLDAAAQALGLPDESAGQQITLVDGRGQVILTNPPVRPGADLVAHARDTVRSPIFGAAPVAGTTWRVYVTLDWAEVSAGVRTQLRNMYLAVGFVLLFACLLVVALHRFVLRPLCRLEGTMAAAIEDESVRAGRQGPRELSNLAARFNTLLDARASARRQLAEAIAQLIAARENEKRALAVALHDDTIQAFVAARWFVGGLAADGSPEPTAEDLDQLLDSLDQGIATLRSQTFELMPPNLGELGLVRAVESLLDSTCARAGLGCHLAHNVPEFTRLSVEAETLTFRTIQEALRNVVKHAAATDVWVSLTLAGDRLEVEVRDNGVGFADDRLGEMVHRSHLGVVSMRETVALAGGQFRLSSGPSGTVAAFTLPLTRVDQPS